MTYRNTDDFSEGRITAAVNASIAEHITATPDDHHARAIDHAIHTNPETPDFLSHIHRANLANGMTPAESYRQLTTHAHQQARHLWDTVCTFVDVDPDDTCAYLMENFLSSLRTHCPGILTYGGLDTTGDILNFLAFLSNKGECDNHYAMTRSQILKTIRCALEDAEMETAAA